VKQCPHHHQPKREGGREEGREGGKEGRKNVPRVIGNALLRSKADGPLHHIHSRDVLDGEEAPSDGGDVREPGEHGHDTLEVVLDKSVGDAVGEHDHLAAQLGREGGREGQ